MPKSGRVHKGKRGYVEGKISGRVRNALDRGGLATRIVKHGQEFRAVLVQELAADDAGRKRRRVEHLGAVVDCGGKRQRIVLFLDA